MPHEHRCMRCHQVFACFTPDDCTAGADVFPRIVMQRAGQPELSMFDHCYSYKGYRGVVGSFERDADVLTGHVLLSHDMVTFEAEDENDLAAAFRESVDDYLTMCRKRGEPPNAPMEVSHE